MAESTGSMSELLRCSVCLERFTSPKVLPCQHTFCFACLLRYAAGAENMDCPQCRENHQLPKGVAGLVDNLVIKNLLTMFDETNECFDCHKSRGLSECQHCAEMVCADCRAIHTELTTEIQMFLKFSGSAPSDGIDSEEKDQWKDFLSKISDCKESVPKKFEELRAKIAKREEDILKYLGTIEKRLQLLVESEPGNLRETLLNELSCCKTTLELIEFKHRLSFTEETLAEFLQCADSECEVLIEDIKGLVVLKFGEKTVDIPQGTPHNDESSLSSCAMKPSLTRALSSNHEEARKFDSSIKPLSSEATGFVLKTSCFPRDLNYKAKNSSLKLYIDHHPEGFGAVLSPSKAVYSSKFDAIFCYSRGDVLKYGLGVGGGKALGSFSAADIAISESGKLIIANGSSVDIVDIEASEKVESKNALVKLQISQGMLCVEQVCCYGNEFAVLDRDESCISVWSEEGKFIRQFEGHDIVSFGTNLRLRMTVDENGQIYLYGDCRIIGRIESGELLGCMHNRKCRNLAITLALDIYIFSWTGDYIETRTIVRTEHFEYMFLGEPCSCCRYRTRNESSVPTDAQIQIDFGPRALCVDGDEFLSLGRGGQIQVYDEKNNPVCTLDGFNDVRDLSLLPDGRMVVCEFGNNRIQIL